MNVKVKIPSFRNPCMDCAYSDDCHFGIRWVHCEDYHKFLNFSFAVARRIARENITRCPKKDTWKYYAPYLVREGIVNDDDNGR